MMKRVDVSDPRRSSLRGQTRVRGSFRGEECFGFGKLWPLRSAVCRHVDQLLIIFAGHGVLLR